MTRKHLRTMPADFRSARPIAFPCAAPRLVPSGRVRANDYNPNRVATAELEALAESIATAGVTQPVVVSYEPETDAYVIVDGFHRYLLLQRVFGMSETPVVVVDKDAAERIASTVRHNKAKGQHQVEPMARLVGLMLAEGLADEQIAARLGMEPEEVLRLKQVAGIA